MTVGTHVFVSNQLFHQGEELSVAVVSLMEKGAQMYTQTAQRFPIQVSTLETVRIRS
jgi:hypothetical protein